MSKIFPKQRGVFLILFVISLAALLAVVLFGGALSSAGRRADVAAQNRESFTVIDAALIQFIQLHLRLPCPADGTIDATNPSAGVENTVSPTDTAICRSPSGVVPWKSLGLLQPATLDGWGRMISYRVFDGAGGFTRTYGLNLSDCLDSDVTQVYPLSAPGGLFCNATTHENTRSDFLATKGLTVNDRGVPKTQVAYALISHGASGYGAYTPSSPPARLAMPPANSKEFFNVNADGTYWILDPSAAEIDAENENHFDDIVSYAVASDLVVAAKAGGREWPLAMILDRSDPDWPSGSTVLLPPPPQPPSMRKIVFNGGPIMMSAFRSGVARYISSIQRISPSSYKPIGARALSGGSGDLTDREGLGFDFRVKRRVLKVMLDDFDSSEKAIFTFYNGATQVGAPLTKSGCHSADFTNFTIDVGSDFTTVEIAAPPTTMMPPFSSDFAIVSIAACQFDDAAHPACTLPLRNPAKDCP